MLLVYITLILFITNIQKYFFIIVGLIPDGVLATLIATKVCRKRR